MKEMWNERYSEQEYAYGTKPNAFLAQELPLLKVGSILLPMDGEGRNAVFCARQGWQTTAFDYSLEGQKKALKLAVENNVNISFDHSSLEEFKSEKSFDAVGLFYTHLPPPLKKMLFDKTFNNLKDGGTLIAEIYSEKQLGNPSGGPKKLDLLYTKEEASSLLTQFSSIKITEETVILNEGKFHQGKANVLRIIAKK